MKPKTKKVLWWVGGLYVLVMIIGAIFSGDNGDEATPSAETTLQEQAQQQANETGESVSMVNMESGEEITAEPARRQQVESRKPKATPFERFRALMLTAYPDDSLVKCVRQAPYCENDIIVEVGHDWKLVTYAMRFHSVELMNRNWDEINSPNSGTVTLKDSQDNIVGGEDFLTGVFVTRSDGSKLYEMNLPYEGDMR